MGLSNSQYESIMRTYYKRQHKNKHEQDERVALVYEKVPAIREIDDEISTVALAKARRILAGNPEALQDFKAQLEDLKQQRKVLLSAAGFSENFMDMWFYCPLCKDSGYVDNVKCRCFRQAETALLYKQSNLDEVLKKQNFATFSFEYYDRNKLVPEVSMSQYDYMQKVVDKCQDFVRDFSRGTKNLLFTGNTGVGKTFLSNCIAKALIDNLYSVIYLSASEFFESFSYKAEHEEGEGNEPHSILSCDLLIIDDLGTELTNTFTTSKLFYCINERLLQKKPVIISTNLSANGLSDFYSERVTSRIISQYEIIPLYGDDIRIQKRFQSKKTVQNPPV